MKKTKSLWYYMHTINNCPAQYVEGSQIYYAHGRRGGQGVRRLATSLKQIKKEQKLSALWRVKQNFTDTFLNYGYVRILRKPKIV